MEKKNSGIFFSSPKIKKNATSIESLIFVTDDWFLRNHIHHPTMRENYRDARSDLTRRVLYFFLQKNFDAFSNVGGVQNFE